MNRLLLLVFWFLCQYAHIVASIWMLLAIISGSPRARNIALAYDRVGNVATGGSGVETLSSRASRGKREGTYRWCLLCKFLDWFEKNHCELSEQSE